MTDEKPEKGASRRQFLTGIGAAGAGLVATSIGGVAPFSALIDRADAAPLSSHGPYGPGTPDNSDDFGRLFASLPPFSEANDRVRAALLEVGMAGGIMDAHDDLAAGAKALIVDPTVNGNPTATNPYGTNPDNPDDDRRVDLRRPVHRPRHHLRPDLAARRAPEPADLAQHPDTGARPGLGIRRRAGSAPRSVRRQPRRDRSARELRDRHRRGARGCAPGGQRQRHVRRHRSAIRATTRTS